MKTQSENTTESRHLTHLKFFQSIDNETDWKRIKNRIQFSEKRRIAVYWRAAAIILMVVGLGITSRQVLFNREVLQTIRSMDEKKEIRLSDGSMVVLNQHSSLAYPERFARKNRLVRLEGEGFFEVAHDPGRPFRVNVAGVAEVEDIGTSFNISSSPENGVVRVQMVEGKVAFYPVNEPDKREVLEGDDQAEMKQGMISRNTRINKNFLSWKTGVIFFEQNEIQDVAKTIEKYYNCKVVLDSSVNRELTFTSVIDNQDLSSVLEELSLVLGISYTLDNDKVEIYMTE